MQPEQLDFLRKSLLAIAEDIYRRKNSDYASANANGEPRDVLKGFKDGFEDTKLQPLDVLLVHMTKQFHAIKAFIKDPDKITSEPIEGRLTDMINYCVFCLALATEYRDKQKEDRQLTLPLQDGYEVHLDARLRES